MRILNNDLIEAIINEANLVQDGLFAIVKSGKYQIAMTYYESCATDRNAEIDTDKEQEYYAIEVLEFIPELTCETELNSIEDVISDNTHCYNWQRVDDRIFNTSRSEAYAEYAQVLAQYSVF